MKILQVTNSIDPANGGPTRSCKGLCRAISQAGVDVTLLVLTGDQKFENPCGVKVIRGWDSVAGKNHSCRVEDFELVHIQGLWNLGLHRIAMACRKAKVPYVFSPRGMLDPWALSVKKWKKRLAMFLYQRRDLRNAAAFHATAEMEKKNIQSKGFIQPIFIVPNAVELPLEHMPRSSSDKSVHTALFLSRLHPGKGLLELADAWAILKRDKSFSAINTWRMRIVGPDNYGHKAQVLEKLKLLGIESDWAFIGEKNDDEKWKEYACADLFVHPSHSENFGISITEALYAELPVITTKGTPWSELQGISQFGGLPYTSKLQRSGRSEGCQKDLVKELEINGRCGWWGDIGVEPLVEALREAIALTDEERYQMGINGKRLIERKYTWSAVAKQMKVAYESCVTSEPINMHDGGIV